MLAVIRALFLLEDVLKIVEWLALSFEKRGCKKGRRSLTYIDSSWRNIVSKFFMGKKREIRTKDDNAPISLIFIVMAKDCKIKGHCLCSNSRFCSKSSFVQRKKYFYHSSEQCPLFQNRLTTSVQLITSFHPLHNSNLPQTSNINQRRQILSHHKTQNLQLFFFPGIISRPKGAAKYTRSIPSSQYFSRNPQFKEKSCCAQ